MQRVFQTFPVGDLREIKNKMLSWASRFGIFCFLDNHDYDFLPHEVDFLLGAGAYDCVNAAAGTALDSLRLFQQREDDWQFGHLGYDLKNETESLSSSQPDRIGFPDLFFFCPEVIVLPARGGIQIGVRKGNPETVWKEILSIPGDPGPSPKQPVVIRQRQSRQEYLDTLETLRAHLRRGDCYEINYCQEFYVDDTPFHPLDVYRRLSAESPNPFSGFYRVEDAYLICASPERYLKRNGRKIISQPIKGTWPRINQTAVMDEQEIKQLQGSRKDRSENVMVVDLVRNDLSRCCEEGTVEVEELYGIRSFPQLHHMLSTVTGRLREGVDLADIIRASFPMGSMTGAPKRRVMELIDRYETTRRGIFSGALGYVKPGGDFDFNVVIRSLTYNRRLQYLSGLVGSGITIYSDPVREYEECLLKLKAIKKVLTR